MIFYAKENITSLFFYVELNHPPPNILGYPSFVNTMERSSLYQLTALKKIFLAPRHPSHQLLLYPKIHKLFLSS